MLANGADVVRFIVSVLGLASRKLVIWSLKKLLLAVVDIVCFCLRLNEIALNVYEYIRNIYLFSQLAF